MPDQDIQISPEQTYKMIPSFAGGINTFRHSGAIDAEEVVAASNVYSQTRQLRSDTGYKKFQNVVKGVPRKPYQFRRINGTIELLLITDWSLFRRLGGVWRLVPKSGTSATTLSSNWTTGADIVVGSVTGVAVGDTVQVELDNGSYHHSTVSALPGGTTVTLADGHVSDATAGNDVIFGKRLNGSPDNPVSVVTLPAEDWVVFTNGIDPVQKYDGNDISALGGLSTINVDTCVALTVFFSYLLLLAPTVSGTIQPQRVRWCDTGAYEIWNAGNASFSDLLDTEGRIIAGAKLGPYSIIYKDDSIVRGELINLENQIFEFNTLIFGEGLIAHDTLIPLRNIHYFMGQNNFYEYLGDFTVEEIAENIYFNVYGVQGDLDPSNRSRSFGRYIRELNELWWLYPQTGDVYPSKLIRYRVDTKAFWFRDFGEEVSGIGFFQQDTTTAWQDAVGNWTQQTQRWNSNSILANAPVSLLCGKADEQVFEYDYLSVTDDGASIAWTFTTKDFFHPNYEVRLDMFEFLAGGSSVLIEYSTDRGQTWNIWKNVTLSAAIRRYQVYGDNGQFVANSIRWRLSGAGPGFIMEYAGFHYNIETTQNLSVAT